MMSTPAAPSVIWDELPAVIRPPSGLNAGLSPANVSTVVSGRIPSSAPKISSVSCPSSSRTGIGMISSSKRPSVRARAARRWLSAAKASISAREICH
jgi:hypothetical protein